MKTISHGLAAIALTLTGAAASPAHAEQAACTVIDDPTTAEICADGYLRGMEQEMLVLLARMAEMNGGEVPEGVQMEYAHGMIGRENCDLSFRCLESVMRDQLSTLNTAVLEWQDTPLVAGIGVRFVPADDASSMGADMFGETEPRNYGYSKYTCQLKCAITDGCAAAHYDAGYSLNGEYGFCSLKTQITLPLLPWSGGTLLIRADILPN